MNANRVMSLVMGLVLCAVGGLMCTPAYAGVSDGHIRAELSLGKGVHSGSYDRDDDTMATLTVGWAFDVAPRVELGLRGIAMYYDADGDEWDGLRDVLDDFDWDNDYGDESIFGLGFGVAARFYTKKDAYNGLFFEVAGHAIVHDDQFPGNDSSVNFYTTGGIGYQFKNNWHLIAKYGHISNAGLSSDNAGANVVSIGVGYSF